MRKKLQKKIDIAVVVAAGIISSILRLCGLRRLS
jgi:hypothetical protein